MKRSYMVTLLLILSIFLSSITILAQTSSHQKAAVEYLKAQKSIEKTQNGVLLMFETRIELNPKLAQFYDIMTKWVKKYFTWEILSPAYIKVTMDTFSEAELREITAFYLTPIGQTMLKKNPELMRESGGITMGIFSKYKPELDKMIEERIKEIESKEK